MRSFLLAAAAAVATLAAGWYVVEWMPSDAVAAASITAAPRRGGQPHEIRSVRILGERLPLTILESHLTTRAGDHLDLAALDTDRRALREVLVARGFWDTAVTGPDFLYDDDGAVHVTFEVVPGAVFHVRHVRVDGEDPAVLASALTLTAGDDVSPDRLTRNAELLAGYLARNGRPGAQVTVETATDRATHAVDVTFVVRRASRS